MSNTKGKDPLDGITEELALTAALAGPKVGGQSAFPPELLELLRLKLAREQKDIEDKETSLRRMIQARKCLWRTVPQI